MKKRSDPTKDILVDALDTPPPEHHKPAARHAIRDSDGLHKRRGKWHFSLNVDGRRKFFSTGVSDYKKAQEIQRRAKNDLDAGKLPGDLAKRPFKDLLAAVVQDRKLRVSPGSQRIDKERSGPLLKYFGSRTVSKIDARAVRDYQAARCEQVSNRTTNLETKLLRFVLKEAKTWARIAPDYKNLPENSEGPGRSLEPEQEKRLFDTARSKPGWQVAYLCALVSATTTMRSIEIKTLRFGNLNLIDREVLIRRSKTPKGHRDVPLNDTALWAFSRLLERATALGASEPQHYVLPAPSKQSRTGYDPTRYQKGWRTAWRALTRAAGLATLRFHDLRHHAITSLAESGASDSTVMALAGHMSRAMMEHYSHIRKAAKLAAVSAIKSYIPEEIAPPALATKSVQ